MPTIPTFENTIQAPAAHIDPEAAGRVGEAIARGGAQLEGLGQTWAERYYQARRAVMASDAMVAAQRGLQASAQQWARKAGTTDENGEIIGTDQAVNGFVDEAQQLRQKTLGQISDPLVQAMVAEHFDHAQITHAEGVRAQGFQLEREARVGKLDQQLYGLSQDAATATTPEAKAQIQTTAATAINTLQHAGFISGAEAATRGIKFTSDVQKVAVQQYMRDASAAMEQGRMTPLAVADAINNPKNFPGLLPTERQSLADTAIRLGRTIVTMQTQAAAAAESQAAKQLKATQQANEIGLLERVRSGQNPPSPEEVARLGKSQQISVAGYQAVTAALARGDKGADDLGVMNDLYTRMAQGEDVHADVLQARANNKLSQTTAEELLKGNATRSQRADTAAAKGAFDELKTALGGHAVEQGLLDFGHEAGRAQAALWAEAQGEWNRRVRINGEDPQAVLPDMLARYQRAPLTPQAWPRPRLGQVNSTQDVAAIWQKTKDAAAAGRITPQQLEQETELLDRYRQFYAQADQRQQAQGRPAAAGGQRAKLRGVETGATE